MSLDIPHAIVTAVIIFAVLWGLDHTTALGDMSKGKKTFVKFLVLFVAIFVLNLVWPYGSGV